MPDVVQVGTSFFSESLELLRVTAESYDRYRDEFAKRNEPLNIFWELLDRFVFDRTLMQPQRMDKTQLALLRQYDEELAVYVRKLIDPARGEDQVAGHFDHFERYEARHFVLVPAIPDMLTESIIRLSTWPLVNNYLAGMFAIREEARDSLDRNDYGTSISDPGYRITKNEILCLQLEKTMQGRNVPFAAIRRAEIAFLRSSGEARAQAARALMDARTAELSTGRTSLVECVSALSLSRWVPMVGQSWTNTRYSTWAGYNERAPAHGQLLLAGLLHHPYPAPDLGLRQIGYLKTIELLSRLQDPRNPDRDGTISALRRVITDAMNEASKNPKSAASLPDLLEGAAMLDRCLGVDIHRALATRFTPLMQDRNTATPHTLTSDAVFDLRGDLADKAALISYPFNEPLNRRILWLQLHPVLDWNTPLVQNDFSFGREGGYPVGRPWLLAVDCVDRKFAHQIDLAARPDLGAERSPKTMRQGSISQGRTASGIASDSAFLLFINWGDRDSPDNHASQEEWLRHKRVAVKIDRASGKVTDLADIPWPDQGFTFAGNLATIGTSLGESFFYVSTKGSWTGDSKSKSMLWHLKPDGSLKMLSLTGRRPELSPFDAEDREVQRLSADGGRLLVCNNTNIGSPTNFYAYYNPKNETWETPTGKEGASLPTRDLQLYAEHINTNSRPHSVFETKGAGGEIRFDAIKAKTGGLIFVRGNNPQQRELPVALKVPESYQATFNFTEPVADQAAKAPTVSVADALAQGKFATVLLSQTDEHLILGLALTSSVNDWKYQSCGYQCLPFLWYVSKDKALAAIRRLESGNK